MSSEIFGFRRDQLQLDQGGFNYIYEYFIISDNGLPLLTAIFQTLLLFLLFGLSVYCYLGYLSDFPFIKTLSVIWNWSVLKNMRKISTRGKRKNYSKSYSDHASSSFRFLNANDLPKEAASFRSRTFRPIQLFHRYQQQQKEQRPREGRCFARRKTGHWRNECPFS